MSDGTASESELSSLPAWLTDEFPEHPPLTVISFTDDKFHVSHDDSTHETFGAAFQRARSASSTHQTKIHESVDGHGGTYDDGVFVTHSDASNSPSEIYISMTTENEVEALENEYRHWLEQIVAEYEKNPNDFLCAHNFLVLHPAFWSKTSPEKSFIWETGIGLDAMSINVFPDEKTGESTIFLEHGLHIKEDGYCRYYHDPRIFVTERTYERAIIAMARKVHATYNPDGTERPDA